MAGVIASIPKFQFSNALGLPMSGGTLTSYLAGTTTPVTTYQDEALTTANTNPISLDSRGECTLWLDSTKVYKFVLKNAAGVTQWTVDNITNSTALAVALDAQLRADLAASSGSSLVGFLQTGAGAVATTLQEKAREIVSAEDYYLSSDSDDTLMIQRAIDAVAAAGGGDVNLSDPQYYISSPLRLPSKVNLVGKNTHGTIIEKTTNTVGTGSNTARSGTVTDSYALDCIIQLIHTDNNYTVYSGIKNVLLKKTTFALSSIAVYAPRANHITLQGVWSLNCAIGFYTFDCWMSSLDDVTVQACNIGFQWANDGSGLGTGTSTKMSNCWVNFDNTIAVPTTGFSFFGLAYSALDDCGVDNGIRVDGAACYAYSFNSCACVTANGVGVENTKGCVVYAGSSSVAFTGLRSISMTGVAGGTVGTVFADTSSSLTFTACSFGATTTPGVIYDWVIQGGATVVEINPAASPSGGSTFVGYGGGASKTRISGTAITRANSSGTFTAAFPTSGTTSVTLTPGTSGSITLNASYATLGWYRIGNQITVTGQLFVSSVSSPVGSLKITGGLPVAVGAATSKYGACTITGYGLTAGATTSLSGRLLPSSSDILIETYAAGALANAAGFIQANSSLIVTAVYIVD